MKSSDNEIKTYFDIYGSHKDEQKEALLFDKHFLRISDNSLGLYTVYILIIYFEII